MQQLKDKYADRDVEFVSMYVREPHPEERGFRGYHQHETYEHKMAYAKELVETKDMDIPVVVDGMDQHHHKTLGNLPNMSYVVDKEGRVRHAETWLLADHVDRILAELVTADRGTRRHDRNPLWDAGVYANCAGRPQRLTEMAAVPPAATTRMRTYADRRFVACAPYSGTRSDRLRARLPRSRRGRGSYAGSW